MGGQRVWEPGGGVPAAVVPPSPTAEERAKLDAVWGSIYRRVMGAQGEAQEVPHGAQYPLPLEGETQGVLRQGLGAVGL